jgi:hypothetical protein
LVNEFNAKRNEFLAVKAEADAHQAVFDRAERIYFRGRDNLNAGIACRNNLKNITSVGVDDLNKPPNARTYNDADDSGFATLIGGLKPQFRIANTDFWPPVEAATEAQCDAPSGNIPTGQHPGARGDKDWAGGPFFIASNIGSIGPGNCQSVVPVGLTKNFKFLGFGDSSIGGDNGYHVTVEDSLPAGWQRIPQLPGTISTYPNRPPENQFAQVTGISALLEGQNQYQALNVYSEPDPEDNRLMIVWSIMSQNNVRNLGGTDVRDPSTAGNRPDCGGGTPNPDDPKQKCQGEAVRYQVTSPLLYVNMPIPVFRPRPIPDLPAFPTVPPISSPPPPPPQGH